MGQSIDVEAFEILLQHEEVVGLIVAGQRGDDLGLGRVTVRIAMLGQALGIALSRHDVPEDPQARHPIAEVGAVVGHGSRSPARIARTIRCPVHPLRSLMTFASWMFIWVSAFCMRWV